MNYKYIQLITLTSYLLGACSTIEKTHDSEYTPTGKPITQGLCVYKTTKGISEVIEKNVSQVNMAFYPGDESFTLTKERLPGIEKMAIGDEFKTEKKYLINGPSHCTRIEYHVIRKN